MVFCIFETNKWVFIGDPTSTFLILRAATKSSQVSKIIVQYVNGNVNWYFYVFFYYYYDSMITTIIINAI